MQLIGGQIELKVCVPQQLEYLWINEHLLCDLLYAEL